MVLLIGGSATAVASLSLPLDTLSYAPYRYVRILADGDSATLSDDEFFDAAGRIVFPVSKWLVPKNDSLLHELEEDVLPRVNADSLQLVRMMIRGAASPEGSYKFNKFLGENRAKYLVDFMNARLTKAVDPEMFSLEIEHEDYRTLCIMMWRNNDPDASIVQSLCDRYLPTGQLNSLKRALQSARQGKLWPRLIKEYFPDLRAARIVLFFRAPKTTVKPEEQLVAVHGTTTTATTTATVGTGKRPDTPDTLYVPVCEPRRELLSVKSNLLFDIAYVPGYNRWCPIPNLAVEYYPLHGHFTFGASLDHPWWQHYGDHKFFQIRNYQLFTRYYFRSGDIARNPVGEGAAFRGLYLSAYAHAGRFGICFDENRGWVGEGGGGGIGAGYVLPISKSGHWRLEFGAQVGYFFCKYDPYQFENPINSLYHDHLYYYKWMGKPADFRKRQYHFSWLGPTRVEVTLSYDFLYRRNHKRGVSFRNWEKHIEPIIIRPAIVEDNP